MSSEMAGEEPSPADVAEIFKAFAGADGKMTADGLADVMINQCDPYNGSALNLFYSAAPQN